MTSGDQTASAVARSPFRPSCSKTLLVPQIFEKPASYPYIDTFIAVSSVLAVVLLARRIFETWVLWILVDITSIGLYRVKGVKLIALEFVIFLALAMLGVISWYRLWRKEENVTVV